MTARTPSPPGLLNAHEIAARCGIAYSTYRKWRMAGKGPDTFRNGKFVYARIEEVDRWWAAQEQADTEPNPEMRPPEPKFSRRPARTAQAQAA